MDKLNLNGLPDLSHLLQDHKILKSFDVNRKVTKQELTKIAKSMGIDIDKVELDELHSIVATISHIEYSCGEVPGTKKSSSRSLQQFQSNYDKLNRLLSLSICVSDLLKIEKLTTNEMIFILNKCIVDLQNEE